MNLEDKLRQLRTAAQKSTRDLELERQLEYLRRLEQMPKTLPAQRVPKGIEEYVDGETAANAWGEFFGVRQTLPFGRPYGKLRIGDVATADLSPLRLFTEDASLPKASEIVYLDTETTGLAGGTGTCAFLIGIAAAQGAQFVVRQFFLRDYPEEKAVLVALAAALEPYRGIVTFNGKAFDVPLLETRYTLARMKSPLARLQHLDLLHPARRLWKLRLESCALGHLEKEVLGVSRVGDISGAEIPGIYFDYLRTGNAHGLQPVFYHNAMDVITLAALTVELARIIGAVEEDGGGQAVESSLDLFSLSRIFDRAGARVEAVRTCQRALELGLPRQLAPRALQHLASQHKRQRHYERAAKIWAELAASEPSLAIDALEELAIYYEHRRRDARAALGFVELALRRLNETSSPRSYLQRFAHRMERLRKKATREAASTAPASRPDECS
jgi:hypothetical protein